MNPKLDTAFAMFSDTPAGKDPDAYSPTLRRYHRMLWSKTLPSGKLFDLSDEHAGSYLYHSSDLGEFFLSSDSIGHTYSGRASMADIMSQLDPTEITEFVRLCSTIGAYLIFPANRIDGKNTINGARGMHPRIDDRIDLTLECIRRYYSGQESPLSDVLARYSDFFGIFETFRGYTAFFLLDDLVKPDGSVEFLLPFESFSQPRPAWTLDSYLDYRDGIFAFVSARNVRIAGASEVSMVA